LNDHGVAIMDRRTAGVGGQFVEDTFADLSGRGARAEAIKVFAFPPLALAGLFLTITPN